MFASYLSYQLIDLGLALCLFGLAHALARRLAPTALRSDALLRFVLLVVPICAIGSLLLAVLCMGPVQDRVYRFSLVHRGEPASVSFLGVGVAFLLGGVLLPIETLRRVRRSSRGPLLRGLLASCALLALGTAAYSVFVEPFRVEVRTVAVPCAYWPAGRPPLRIAVLADLQSPLFTAREQAVVERMAELDVDVVVLPGDLVGQSFAPDLAIASARRVLGTLRAPLGVYAVTGDVDGFVPGGLPRILEGTRAVDLDQGRVELGGPQVELYGFDPGRPQEYRAALRDCAQRAAAESAAGSDPPLRIAIVHRPRHAEEIAAHGVDVVVAGHTHGGQVVVPGFGPPVTASPLPRAIAQGGLHRLESGGWLFVSRGIGLEAGFAPPIRFCCPPEIVVLEIGPAPLEPL